MGTGNSIALPAEEIESICNETGSMNDRRRSKNVLFSSYLGFTPKELRRLYQRFQELQKKKTPGDYLSREDLLSVREVALNPLGERLVDVIVQDYGRSILSRSDFT